MAAASGLDRLIVGNPDDQLQLKMVVNGGFVLRNV